MAATKAKDIRELSSDERLKRLRDLKQESMNLRLQHSAEPSKTPPASSKCAARSLKSTPSLTKRPELERVANLDPHPNDPPP